MKCLLLAAVLIGYSSAIPSLLGGTDSHSHSEHSNSHSGDSHSAGYRYDPPNGLYELPEETPETTTTPVVRTPDKSYLPPDVEREDPKETTMMPMPYAFKYNVEEEGNAFGEEIKSDGENVEGEYRVLLPDGKLQVVRFTSDPENGYQAEVSYE